jgi:hypothetical protein
MLQRSLLLLIALGLSTLAAPLAGQAKGKILFERHVLPILERNCFECHRATYTDKNGRRKRPKGRVMFDTLANIKKSKRGKLFVGKKPEDSLVLDAITLPPDDEDRMPPAKAGPPLSKRDVDLITNWVKQGADFGSWTGEAKGKTAKPRSKPSTSRGSSTKSKKPTARKGPHPRVTLSKGLKPIPQATLESFANSPFRVQSVGDGNPLLTVSCCGQTEDVTDSSIAQLAVIADHIYELDLARSGVGDGCCMELAKMKRLVKLDLRQTRVSNAGVKELAACKELRILNLFDTDTGDYALNALLSLKKLERLYLYKTKASQRGIKRLKEAIPGVRIVASLDMPEPMAETPRNNRRRGKKK